MDMDLVPPNLVRLNAEAERLGVHPRTLWRRVESGELQSYRIPGDRWAYVCRDEVARVFAPRPVLRNVARVIVPEQRAVTS